MQIIIVDKKLAFVTLNSCNSIYLNVEKNYYNVCNKKIVCSFMITNEGLIFVKFRTNYVPLSMKILQRYYCITVMKDFFDFYFEYLISKNSFFKDIKGEILQNTVFLPVYINKMFTYNNKKQLFISEYKHAVDLKINYNKRDMSYSYILIKVKNYITEKSYAHLLQESCFNFMNYIDGQYLINDFFKQYYIFKNNILRGSDEYFEFGNYVDDYVRFCRKLKKKIDLTLTPKRLIKEHNNLVIEVINKGTKSFKITKDSQFNILDKYFSNDIERICTKKRLMFEGEIQRHCVATYADKIRSDRCSIYSYIADGKRITFEIIKRRNKFILNQAKYRFNQTVPKEEINKINAVLSKANKEQQVILKDKKVI